MMHNVSIMAVGLCLFTLAVMLLPDGFAMLIDDEGNLGPKPAPFGTLGAQKERPQRGSALGPLGDREDRS